MIHKVWRAVFRPPIVLMALLILGGAFSLAAQDLSGISICVDPGHGKGNSNAGPTGLREADINLQVALEWRKWLRAAKIDTVLLTRESDDENPTLSQRERIANQFGVTWFHSVHHNATGGVNHSARYTLVLYEELANHQPQWPGQADVMSRLMADWVQAGLRTSDARVFGDFTFYGSPSWLGVLNDLQMPGELSEATFHDHPVEEAKLKNPDFLELEALGLHRAVLEYFDAGPMPTGSLSGIVRGADTGRPVSGAVVRLLPPDSLYTTDDNGNGLYVFADLPPGNYHLEVTAAGYDTARADVSVQANEFTALDFSLIPNISPTVVAARPKNGDSGVGPFSKILLKFSQPMNHASVERAFRMNPPIGGVLTSDTQKKVFTFDPAAPLQAGTTYQVIVDSQAVDRYGHIFDGDGDGTPGGDFMLEFRTAPLDTSAPMAIDVFPPKFAEEVFPRQPITVRFNHPVDLSTVLLRQTLVITNDRSRRLIDYRFEQNEEKAVLSILPQEPLLAGARYFITLRTAIMDSAGTRLLEEVKWTFTTAMVADNWERISVFNGDDNPFLPPLESPRTLGVLGDSTAAQLAPQPAYSAVGALDIHSAAQDTTAQVALEFMRRDILLEPGWVAFAALLSPNREGEVRLWLEDSTGAAYFKSVRIPAGGWRGIVYRAGSDSVVAENGELHLQGNESWIWRGILFRPDSTGPVQFFVDDIYVNLPQNVTSVPQPVAPPGGFEVAPPQPNPVTAGAQEVVVRLRPAVAAPVSLTVFDLLGRLVFRRRMNGAQRKDFRWNLTDRHGKRVPAGVYFLRVQTRAVQRAFKIVVLP